MREVRLYGHLGKKYGKTFSLAVNSPAEAVAALKANFPDFAKDVAGHKPGYYVFVGKQNIGSDHLTVMNVGEDVIKIVPLVAGAKSGGVLQMVVGAVLVVAGAYFSQPWMVSMGASLMVGGIAQALIKAPKTNTTPSEGDGRSPSYAFNGPVNTSAQGHVVPVVYGRVTVGSQVVSAGISVEQVAV